jgi:hypothetical protein
MDPELLQGSLAARMNLSTIGYENPQCSAYLFKVIRTLV